MLLPRSVPSEGAPGVPEPEELWEAEMERLRGSGAPVRGLPYAMMDKRLIWQLREPAGVQTLRWQRWQRRRQTVERRLREAAQRLARGLGLWERALYEIGGRTRATRTSPCPLWNPTAQIGKRRVASSHLPSPGSPDQSAPPPSHPFRPQAPQTSGPRSTLRPLRHRNPVLLHLPPLPAATQPAEPAAHRKLRAAAP
ncbi:TMC8 isoform 1, partial [Pongo abelii]